MKYIERYGLFEVECLGCSEGNPYIERHLKGVFRGKHEEVTVRGFYDGNGSYKVRFMPSFEGEYEYRIYGNINGDTDAEKCCEYEGVEHTTIAEGTFTVIPPAEDNHGPVHVAGMHFAYADGTPYFSIGTTCYVWDLQSDELIEKTICSLKNSAFNKIRFCIFPKHYDYNLGEPRSYPYEGTPMDSSVLTKENFNDYTFKTEGNHFDYTRFNPKHFRHIERLIIELQKLGIEADIIVMHPYDRWGFSSMTKEQNRQYWKYVIARFAAYRNVWWSLANEYDIIPSKDLTDWEEYGEIICREDPYGHLRSVHNCLAFYDFTRPWITHCSIQRQDIYKTAEYVNEWRDRFKKPVVLDEISYEGNIQHGWGNISAQEMVRRFWECVCRGGYPGHGETYMSPDNVLWWSHGGELHGESWKRFSLLYDVMKEMPGAGLQPYSGASWDEICGVPECEGVFPVKSYYLFYYSFMQPSFRFYHLDDETEFRVRVIDTWNMTVEERGSFKGAFRLELPGRPYMAVLITKIVK